MFKKSLLIKFLLTLFVCNFLFASLSFSIDDTANDTTNDDSSTTPKSLADKLKDSLGKLNLLGTNPNTDDTNSDTNNNTNDKTFDTTIDTTFDTTFSGDKKDIKALDKDDELDASKSVQEFAIAKAKRNFEGALSVKDEQAILKARAELISEYEKSIPLVCMPNFYKEASYEVDNDNTKCQSQVDELLKIYPFSPIALCAKYGYRDKNCLEAYLHIVVSNSFPKNNEKKELPELTEIFKKLDNAKLPKLKDDYEKAKRTYTLKNNTRNFMSVILAADKVVNILCSNKMESYSTSCSTCKKEEEKVDLNDLDLFADIKKDLGIEDLKKDIKKLNDNKDKDSDTNGIQASKVDKIIYITQDCQNFLHDVSNFEPRYPSSVCILHGAYSPKCLSAIRAWPLYIKSKYAIEHKNNKPKTEETKDNTAFESF